MRVLGIETSCDETAAAIVDDRGNVLAQVVHSQVELHAPFGGIVPELASRDHMNKLDPVVAGAMEHAGLGFADIDGIAVTCRPGLTGALLVGTGYARGLAFALGKPVVGVDHLVGHLLAAYLRMPNSGAAPELPFVALLASGGHTALYRVNGFDLDQIQELGATRDDAAGEAFDKVAKLLGLGYPGGPVVDRLAKEGDARRIQLSKPMPARRSLEFSFSGLKTQVMRWVKENGRPGDDQTLRDLCAAFQARVVDALVAKTMRAAEREAVSTVVLAGGVAANRELREKSAAACKSLGLELCIPPLLACTDNAAMIAYAGVHRLARGDNDLNTMETSPHTALLTVTRKGSGRR